ncbi:MAG: Gfo/Idh/MocA family oxidoreductase [Clostridia bacterium]|nr:Gfo/Idh/MocA family oxidoreductase [Clostridia bacterium]
MNIAFAGLRHDHIYSLYNEAKAHPDLTVVGAWEEQPVFAEEAKSTISEPFYDSYEALLADPTVDIVAIGDYYGIRGQRVLQALRAGKAVITDKPLCTSLEELDEIEKLSREKSIPVGIQLELRDDPVLQLAEKIVASGELGEIRSVTFTAQHPLNYGVRPGWYFEEGKHGGTFNDIAIHAMDALTWIAGSAYDKTLFARQWNDYATEVPQFKDSAQFNGLLANGAAVMGDVSYAGPKAAFGLPSYWRFTFWGTKGWLECKAGGSTVAVASAADDKPRTLEAEQPVKRALDGFLREVRAGVSADNTAGCIAASRAALKLQRYADEQR